ncbi:MAG: uridine diphosphate-N-acetylglucosamine-binding protein YvcK [Jiangellaceae bacterium]|nr:uridine diphosphate-N-acetylglucosamine-binding protein YvcK [Jiangellaceae bacterium]
MTTTGEWQRLAGPKVVALGGGHGLAASLSALRRVSGRLSAVVTVADDGGSSGRLRRELGVLPPGDLRMALAALCGDDDWGHTWARVLQHRFASSGELHNHSVGNLLIVALWELLDGHVEGLDWVGRLLGAQGRVLPMSSTALDIQALVARLERGASARREMETVVGQHAVATALGTVVAVELLPHDPPACPEALTAIEEADWVVLGPGSWFTSVIPHLLVPDLRDALLTTSARRLVTLNLSAEGGETEGFTPEMYIEVLGAYAPELTIDAVLADPGSVPDERLLRRVAGDFGAALTVAKIAMDDGTARHDPQRLAHAYAEIFAREQTHGRIREWR